ncbi:MAG: CBS domain-containing protein [Magnetococcales bacterium]|nr:CBS domain-containing protein [Magnetococcales bacterium]MBF0437525.1 CBS domain-containing protein [Magnetococcales bacterium]
MLIKDVMVKSIRTTTRDASVRSVALIICTNKISGLPVVEGTDKLVGMISEKDILNGLLPGYRSFLHNPKITLDFEAMENVYQEILSRKVEDLMTSRVFSVSPEDPIMMAASQMDLHRFRRIPVVENGDKLVGIVSLGDIHKAIFKRELAL